MPPPLKHLPWGPNTSSLGVRIPERYLTLEYLSSQLRLRSSPALSWPPLLSRLPSSTAHGQLLCKAFHTHCSATLAAPLYPVTDPVTCIVIICSRYLPASHPPRTNPSLPTLVYFPLLPQHQYSPWPEYLLSKCWLDEKIIDQCWMFSCFWGKKSVGDLSKDLKIKVVFRCELLLLSIKQVILTWWR